MRKDYFFLNSDCFFVSGAVNAAIYDLSRGDVYSVDGSGREITGLCEQGVPVSSIYQRVKNTTKDEINDYLQKLETLGVGSFSQNPAPPAKITINPLPYTLNKIWLELTDNCNFRCIHCYADSSPCKDNKKFNLKRFEKIISESADLGARWIQFIGGEPLLCGKKNIFALVTRARNAQIDFIEIFTNGSLIDDEYINFFTEHGVHIAMSIFSKRPEVHDSITGVPGSFKRLLKNAEKLGSRGVPFRFGLVVMKQNDQYEQETLEWIRTKFKDTFVSCDIIRCTVGGRDSQIPLLTTDLWKRRLRIEASFPKVTLESFARSKSGHSCFNGEICVHADGTVYPCIMDREHILGNINQSTLQEIIDAPAARTMWGLSRDRIPICRDCEFRYACFDCRPISTAIAKSLGQSQPNLLIKDPYCLYEPCKGEWGNAEAFMEKIASKESLPKSQKIQLK